MSGISADELQAFGYRIVDAFVEQVRLPASERPAVVFPVTSLHRRSEFEVGEWSVCPLLNQLRRGREVRSVEPRVMRLLGCLADRVDQVTTRNELLAAVWGSTAVMDESLTTAVARLRAALGDSSSDQRYVQTVRGVGYRMVAPVRRLHDEDRRTPQGPPLSLMDAPAPPALSRVIESAGRTVSRGAPSRAANVR